jgi:hypothetical protein
VTVKRKTLTGARRCPECRKPFRERGNSRFCHACRTEKAEAGLAWCIVEEKWKPTSEFYIESRSGRPSSKCRSCARIQLAEVRERHNKERADARGRGGYPERTVQRMLKAFRETNNLAYAARTTGMNINTARRYRDAAQAEGKLDDPELPPDPKPYDDLDDDAQQGVDDPAFFSSHFLGINLFPWQVEVIWTLYKLYLSGAEEYVILNVAPRTGKTKVVTFVFVLWVMVRERALGEEPTVHLGHKTEPKAKWYLHEIRREVTTNWKLVRAYGRFRPNDPMARWSRDQIDVEPLETTILRQKEPTVSVGSYEKGELSGGYKLIIWDDLIDRENALSENARNTLLEWWEQEAESRIERDDERNRGGLMVLSNARYSPEDLSYTLAHQRDPDEEEDGEPKPLYRRIKYKAHYDENCDGDHRGPYPDGCLLAPARLSWGRLRRQQVKNPGRYELVYQQEDTDPVGFLAQREWFEGGIDTFGVKRPGCFVDVPFGRIPPGLGMPLVSAVSVDPSASMWWSVVHFLGFPDGRHLAYRAVRKPLHAPDLLYREATGEYTGVLEEFYQASKGTVPIRYVIVEARSQQKWIMQYPFFREWAMSRGIALMAHDTNRINKADPDRGVEMLKHLYRDARVLIPSGGYEERFFAEAWRKEACAWPEGSTSDIVMSHWFFLYNLQNLLAVESEETGTDSEPPPEWAEEMLKAPDWARDMLSGMPGR